VINQLLKFKTHQYKHSLNALSVFLMFKKFNLEEFS